jgi:hypothetical protein
LIATPLVSRLATPRHHVRGKTNFINRFNPITPVQPLRKNISLSFFQKLMISCGHPASTGGAYRDRHGRRRWDAMDAMVSQCAVRTPTNGIVADGEVVWSWHPDADAKPVMMRKRRAGDGGQKARCTEESAYKL